MTHNTERSDGEQEIEVEPDLENGGAEGKIKKLKTENTRLSEERREYLEGWQRAKADFINYKKDDAKRAEELLRFAAGSLIAEILIVLDSFDLAIGSMAAGGDDRGLSLIRAQLKDILRRHGLEEITTGPGEMFSPERHESIGEEESDAPDGSIASVLQKGYLLRGKIIRPARVKLSKVKQSG